MTTTQILVASAFEATGSHPGRGRLLAEEMLSGSASRYRLLVSLFLIGVLMRLVGASARLLPEGHPVRVYWTSRADDGARKAKRWRQIGRRRR